MKGRPLPPAPPRAERGDYKGGNRNTPLQPPQERGEASPLAPLQRARGVLYLNPQASTLQPLPYPLPKEEGGLPSSREEGNTPPLAPQAPSYLPQKGEDTPPPSPPRTGRGTGKRKEINSCNSRSSVPNTPRPFSLPPLAPQAPSYLPQKGKVFY